MKKYLVALVVLLPLVASAQSTSSTISLEELVKQLQTQIQSLQAQITDLQAQVKSVKIELAFTRALAQGSSGDDVKKLQEFLKTFPDVYPEGLVTGYFGSLTEAAVKRFQEQNGIESIGVVGPKTQAKLKEVSVGVSVGGGSANISNNASSVSGATNSSQAVTTSTVVVTTSTSTSTPSGTIPAIPATPAVPSGGGGGGASPATPAVPATPAQPHDTTPPVISNIQAINTTASSTTITWTTNEAASSQVNYTNTSSTLSSATGTVTMVGNTTNHSVAINNLSQSTAYHYFVTSNDEKGNTATSSEQFFTTLALPLPPPPPVVTSYPTCGQIVKNVPGDFSSIQAAIDAASSGDTIKVAAGTFNEGIKINKGGLCLEGAGIDQTIVTNTNNAVIMIGQGGQAPYVIIRNLTVKGGNNLIGTMPANGMGGGIFTFNSDNIRIEFCRITQNTAYSGGGIYANHTNNLTVDHCLIDNNHAVNMAGGIVMEPANRGGVFTNNTIVNNTANGKIGGMSYSAEQGQSSDVIIRNSIIWGNTGPTSGDGMQFVGSTNLGGVSWTQLAPPTVTFSDIGGWDIGADNINIDPIFMSSTDYHLQAGSPATGMGIYP